MAEIGAESPFSRITAKVASVLHIHLAQPAVADIPKPLALPSTRRMKASCIQKPLRASRVWGTLFESRISDLDPQTLPEFTQEAAGVAGLLDPTKICRIRLSVRSGNPDIIRTGMSTEPGSATF